MMRVPSELREFLSRAKERGMRLEERHGRHPLRLVSPSGKAFPIPVNTDRRWILQETIALIRRETGIDLRPGNAVLRRESERRAAREAPAAPPAIATGPSPAPPPSDDRSAAIIQASPAPVAEAPEETAMAKRGGTTNGRSKFLPETLERKRRALARLERLARRKGLVGHRSIAEAIGLNPATVYGWLLRRNTPELKTIEPALQLLAELPDAPAPAGEGPAAVYVTRPMLEATVPAATEGAARDRELAAMQTAGDAIGPLDGPARARVLRWLAETLG